MYNKTLRTYIVEQGKKTFQESVKEIVREVYLDMILASKKSPVQEAQQNSLVEDLVEAQIKALQADGVEITEEIINSIKDTLNASAPEKKDTSGFSIAVDGKQGPILAYINYAPWLAKPQKMTKEGKVTQEIFCIKPSKSSLTKEQQEAGELGIVNIEPADGTIYPMVIVDFNKDIRIAEYRAGNDVRVSCTAMYDRFSSGSKGTPRYPNGWCNTCDSCQFSPMAGKQCKLVRQNIVFLGGKIDGKNIVVGPVLWKTSGAIDFSLFCDKKTSPCYQDRSSKGLWANITRIEDLKKVQDMATARSKHTMLPLDSTPVFSDKTLESKMRVITGAFYKALKEAYTPIIPQQIATTETHSQEEEMGEFGNMPE